jgi:hypothetical protein
MVKSYELNDSKHFSNAFYSSLLHRSNFRLLLLICSFLCSLPCHRCLVFCDCLNLFTYKYHKSFSASSGCLNWSFRPNSLTPSIHSQPCLIYSDQMSQPIQHSPFNICYQTGNLHTFISSWLDLIHRTPCAIRTRCSKCSFPTYLTQFSITFFSYGACLTPMHHR